MITEDRRLRRRRTLAGFVGVIDGLGLALERGRERGRDVRAS